MKNISKVKRRSLGKIGRLRLGKEWLKEHKGNNVVNDYKMYFGVNEVCVFKDLEELGIKFEEEYKKVVLEKVRQKEEQRIRTKERQKEIKEQEEFERMAEDTDGDFYYMAGYTSGGVPYGVSWGEIGINPNLPYEEKVRIKNSIDNPSKKTKKK